MNPEIKDRLEKIRNGIVPEGYKKTKIGIIPEEWDVKKFYKICNKYFNGGTPSTKKSEYWKGDIPWITGADIIDFKINEVRRYISEEAVNNSATNVIEAGNILIVTRTGVGKLTIAPFDIAISQDLTGVYCKKEIIQVFYLFYFLCFTIKFLSRLNQGTSINGITRNTLRNHFVNIPPLNEQSHIATILTTWDKAIELKEKLIEQKKLQKKGLMQILLTGKKRVINPETGKPFDDEWEELKLGKIGKTFTGLSGKNKSDFGNGKPFITYMNVFNNSKINLQLVDHVDISENENQNTVKYGDILFTISSETPNEVGMTSVILDFIQGVYLNSFCFGYRLNNFNYLSPFFSRYYFRGKKIRKELFRLAQGSTRFNLSKIEVLKITVEIPKLEEQQAIAFVLSTADKEIELLEKELELLQEQKRGLMQLLLTGIVRVK